MYVYRPSSGGAEEHFRIDGDAASVNLGQMFVFFPGDFDRDGVERIVSAEFFRLLQEHVTRRFLPSAGRRREGAWE